MIEYLVFYTEVYVDGYAEMCATIKRETPIESGDDYNQMATDLHNHAKKIGSKVTGTAITNIIRLPY